MNEFYHALKDQAIKKYKYEIKPDASYSKEALSIPTYKAMYNKQQIVSIVNRIGQNPAGNNCQRFAIAFVLAVRNNEYRRFEDVTSPFDIVFDTIINKAFEFKNWFISKSVECQSIQSLFDRRDPFIAIVSVKWKKGNGGHVFNAIRIDNKTYVVDCQEKKVELASTSKYLSKNEIDYNNSFVLDMTHAVLDRELIDISFGLSYRKFFLNDNGPYTSIIEGLAKLDTANTTYTVSMNNTVIGRIRCDIRTDENYNFIDSNSPENRVYYVYKYHWESCNIPSTEALSDKESDVSISKYNGAKEELEIIRQCVNLSARSINPKDEGYDKTTFEKLVNNKDKGPYWIIRNGNDIIGSVSIRSSTVGADKVYKCSAINDFAILEKYQSKGLGKKLFLQ